MPNARNSFNLIGRLTKDPELRYTTSGIAICNISIASDDVVGKDAEKSTSFYNLVLWRGTAEYVANYLGKGRLVAVAGRLKQNRWVSSEGKNLSKIELMVDDLVSLESPKNGNGGKSAPAPPEPQETKESEEDDGFDPFSEE